ncbi:hypothetical protein ACHAWF_001856 [Thalassiosira exigua]
MGSQSKANHRTSVEVLVKVLKYIQANAEEAEDELVANELWKLGGYLTCSVVASLCGNEGFMMDLAGLRQHIDNGRHGEVPAKITKETILTEQECLRLPHVAICLFGKVKGETIFDHHIINVANLTRSGFRLRWWLEKVISVCESESRFAGPVFADANGRLASSLEYDVAFREYMERVQKGPGDLIPKHYDDKSMYGISCTPRKTAQIRIKKRAGFGETFQNVFNHWRGVERACARRVRRPMHEYYSEEASLLMPSTWLGAHVP